MARILFLALLMFTTLASIAHNRKAFVENLDRECRKVGFHQSICHCQSQTTANKTPILFFVPVIGTRFFAPSTDERLAIDDDAWRYCVR